MSVCKSIRVFECLCVSLGVYLGVREFECPSISVSGCLCVGVWVCMCVGVLVCLGVWAFVCSFECLCVWASVW